MIRERMWEMGESHELWRLRASASNISVVSR